MPEYEYEALDSSGKSVTGTSSHPNEAFARAKLEELGLYPVRLAVIPSSVPKKKLWNGTFGDAFQWFFWGVCIPVAGLIGALNTGEVHPAVGMILAAVIGLVMITIRIRTGKWPEGGEYGGGQ